MSATLAIFSPNQNAYSETFIQAHRQLPFDIRFYYGGWVPYWLEGKSMMTLPWKLRIEKKLQKRFSPAEKKLMYSLKNEQVRVVLAEYGPAAAECLPVVQFLKLPLIVHFHGHDASVNNLVNGYKERYQRVFEYASAVVAVSQKMKNDLLEMGCPAAKLILNPYGPNPEFFTLNPQYSNQQFLAIGRFVEKKAPHLTLLAFHKALQQFPDAHLKMIGDGPLWQVCKDLVIHLGMENRVELLGVQPPAKIQMEMEQSLAFVQHSVTAKDGDSEGTPVAVLEAQAAGLPVVATEHAGIPDVVVHNQTGLLSKERDVETMANNMLSILQEDGLAQRLGTIGRKRIQEHFTMERHLQTLTDCINKAVNS